MVDLAVFYAKLLHIPTVYYPYVLAGHKDRGNALPGFLEGVNANSGTDGTAVLVKEGDSRIDAPVWFGDLSKAKVRVVVAGMEPRHTENKYNIMRTGDMVYASPFGADKWRRNSKNIYYQALSPLLVPGVFVLLTDLVKDYRVESLSDKRLSDKLARKQFSEKFLTLAGSSFTSSYKQMFQEECLLVRPTHMIAFGRETEQLLTNAGYEPLYICHPANGGMNRAKEQISDLIADIRA